MKPRNPPLQSTRLLDQVRERIRYLHYSLSTEKNYLYWIRFFIRQQAVNGQVREIAGSVLAATFVNFVVGTAVLLIVAIVHTAVSGWPAAVPTNPVLYLAGLIGVIFIAAAALLVRIVGVLLLGLGTIAGQLSGSLILDLAVPIPGHVIAATTVAGTILTLLAVGLAALPSRLIRRQSHLG